MCRQAIGRKASAATPRSKACIIGLSKVWVYYVGYRFVFRLYVFF